MKTVKTQFESGEKVFTLRDFKIVEVVIEEAKITINKDIIDVDYYLLDSKGECDFKTVKESNLFLIKGDLIKSLG